MINVLRANAPKMANETLVSLTSYPTLSSGSFCMAGISQNIAYSLTGSQNTNLVYTPANISSIFSVGSTPINVVNQPVVSERSQTGNIYTGSATGTNFAIRGFSSGANTTSTYTNSITANRASREILQAGLSIGANVKHSYTTAINNVSQANGGLVTLGGISSLTFTYYLLRANGTLVTIGTTGNIAAGNIMQVAGTQANSSYIYFYGLVDNNFTPQITQLGDRVLIQPSLVISGTYNCSAAQQAWVEGQLRFGLTGSSASSFGTNASFRPFLFSVS